MSWISWNCRGLAATSTLRELKELCSKYKSALVFLSETIVVGSKAFVEDIADVKNWEVTFLYGNPTFHQRRHLWSRLHALRTGSNRPWTILGDFNEFLHQHEKDGLHPHQQHHMDLFRQFVSDMGLMDLELKGCRWHNRTFRRADHQIFNLNEELHQLLNVDTIEFGNKWEWIQDLRRQIDALRRQEGLYWAQSSRLKWLQYGEKNSKFFHASTIQRRDRNKLFRLKDSEGNWVEGQQEVEDLVLDHYREVYKSDGSEAVLEFLPACA
ncbi:Endonuclease/exonuclease/phosphatase superfamily [Sesbania bispinosa]|nr:Endonuclease/exonuclease/phosphatase superfamily [Sesbania bispinosa]